MQENNTPNHTMIHHTKAYDACMTIILWSDKYCMINHTRDRSSIFLSYTIIFRKYDVIQLKYDRHTTVILLLYDITVDFV